MSQGSRKSGRNKPRASHIGMEIEMEVDMDLEMENGTSLDSEGRCLGLASGTTATISTSDQVEAHIKPWSKQSNNLLSQSLPNYHPSYYHNFSTSLSAHQPISRETSMIKNTPVLPFFHKPTVYLNTRARKQTADITLGDDMLSLTTRHTPSRRQRLVTAFRAFKRPFNRAQSEPLEVGESHKNEDVIMAYNGDRRGLRRRNSNMALADLRRDIDAMTVDSDSDTDTETDAATEPDSTMDRDAMVEDTAADTNAKPAAPRAPSPAPTEVEFPDPEIIVADIRSMGIIVRDYAYINPPRPKTKLATVNSVSTPPSTSLTPATSASDVTAPAPSEVIEEVAEDIAEDEDEDDAEDDEYPINDATTSCVPFTPSAELFDARKGIGHVFFRWQQVKNNERQFPILGSTLRRLIDMGWIKESVLQNPNLCLPMDLEALAAHDARPIYPWRPMVREPVPDMATMEMYASVMQAHFVGYERMLEVEAYQAQREEAEEARTQKLLRDYEAKMRKSKIKTIVEHRQMERERKWWEEEERRRREGGERGSMNRIVTNKRRREEDDDQVEGWRKGRKEEKKRRITPVNSRSQTSFSQPNPLTRSMSMSFHMDDDGDEGEAYSQPLPSTSTSRARPTRPRPVPRNANPPRATTSAASTIQLRAPTQQFPAPLYSYDPEVFPEAAKAIALAPERQGDPLSRPGRSPPPSQTKEVEAEGDGEGEGKRATRKGAKLVHPREMKAMKRGMRRTQTVAQLAV